MGRRAIPIVSPKETVSSTPVVWVGPPPPGVGVFSMFHGDFFFNMGFYGKSAGESTLSRIYRDLKSTITTGINLAVRCGS